MTPINIRPVTDLRNHYSDVESDVQKGPVFLTKNGVGSLVVMSMECYEQNRYASMVYDKLREAELQAASSSERIPHADVMSRLRAMIDKAEGQ